MAVAVWRRWWEQPTTAWRTEVLEEIHRVRDEIDRLPKDQIAKPAITQAREALQRAEAAAKERRSLAAWWSGDQIERAWLAIHQAREDIAAAADRATELHAMQTKHRSSDEWHKSVRQLRNVLWMLTGALTAGVSIALIVDPDHRSIILIGALAGALTGILPLASATKLTSPYGLTGVQALLKIPAGGAAALLGVYLLAGGGLGPLAPAVGPNTTFYAVLFGLSQQALTRIADRQADKLAQ